MAVKGVIIGGRSDIKRVLLDGATLYEESGGGGGGGGELPAIYQRCAWVQSTGNQYISLPWHFRGKATLEIRANVGAATTRVCGVVENNGANRFAMTRTNNTSMTFYFTSGGALTSKGGADDVDWHTYRFEVEAGQKPKIYVDGTLVATAEKTADSITTTNPFIVFGEWYNTARRGLGTTQLDYLKLWGPTDELEAHLLSIYRKADGVIGLYDMCGLVSAATNTSFFTNEGTGAFTKGADVAQ